MEKKINYLVKVFMAFGLLFTNIMPFSTVLAEELVDSNDPVVSDTTNENEVVDDKTSDASGEAIPTDGNELDNDKKTDSENTNDEFVQDNTTTETNSQDNEGTTDKENENSGNDTTNEENTQNEIFFTVELNDEYQIVIKYNGEYSEGNILNVTENLTYIDNTSSGDVNKTIELTDEVKNALSNEGYVIDSQILLENQYPGKYIVTATLGENSDTFEDTIEYSEMDFEFDLLAYENEDSLYADVIMPDENGKYIVGKDYKNLKVVALIGQGNTCPSMSFVQGMTEYHAEDILSGIEIEDITLDGHLYGEFNLPLSGTFTDCSGQTIELNENRSIIYGTYQDNTDVLNESAKNVELDEKYVFFGDTANGYVYTLDEIDSSEVENIIKDAIEGTEIEYSITLENNELSVTLTDTLGIEITYTSVALSDNTKIVARFDTDTDEVSSGDTFTLSYVVTLNDFKINGINGLVTYDKELLKLNDISASKFTVGNNKDDKFTYVGDSIGGTEVTDEEGNVTGYEDEEYILLTLTFEALKAGEATVSIENAKFYDASVYYEADGEITKTIIINESTDNSLSSLKVAGQEITLSDDTLEYAITVGNDVTSADVEAIVRNAASSITSIAAPEELAVGENTITIIVTAENGDEKVYTIKVTREEAKEEQTTSTVAPVSYQEPTYNDDSKDKVEVVETPNKADDNKTTGDNEEQTKNGNKVSRIIVIILILLAIAGLIYLIFKDDDDEETKQTNKDIDKLKKEDEEKVKHDNINKKQNNNNYNRNNKKNNSYNKNNNKNSNKKGR